MNRTIGIAFGIANQLLFAYTVARLFCFLWGDHADAGQGPLWQDLLLACGFAVPHSVLLLPACRNRLRASISGAFFGCAFCTWTCVSLLTLMACWRSDSRCLWDTSGSLRSSIQVAYLGSWGALVYSLWISGLGRQTGWTNWYAWVRRRPLPAPEFAPRSLYRWLRHPIYFSFLGLIWFTPRMTFDHAALTAVWTVYIFVGSRLKDARLEHYLGDDYRTYEQRVPGFPLVFFGPLGRHRVPGRS